MPKHQIIMGCGIAVMSLVGLWHAGWILEHTRKGAWLREHAGESRAGWILRGFFLGTTILGVLLAVDIVRPVQW